MQHLGDDCQTTQLDSETGKPKSKSNIPNTATGFVELLDRLNEKKAPNPNVVIEPTGMYHEAAALALADAGLVVSLVNPAQLRAFAQGLGVKNKTDKQDSAVLARFGMAQNPAPWQPPSLSARHLKALLARRDAVADDLQRERKRKEANDFSSVPEAVGASIAESIAFLQAELKRLEKMIAKHINDNPELRYTTKLLKTIPGVGPRVSTQMPTDLLVERLSAPSSWRPI